MRLRGVVGAGLITGLMTGAAPAVAADGTVPAREPVRLVVADGRAAGEADIVTQSLGDGKWRVTADITKLTAHRGCVVLQADDGPVGEDWEAPSGQILAMQCGTAGTTGRVTADTSHSQLRLRWMPYEGTSEAWVSSPASAFAPTAAT